MDVILAAGLLVVIFADLALGQFDRDKKVEGIENMSMDQIISRAMGGTSILQQMTVPGGLLLAELDMYLGQEQYQKLYQSNSKPRRKKRKAIRSAILRWPNALVPYSFDNRGYNDVDKYFIKVAMREWEKYTCLRFKERTNERNYVLFQDGFGCNSQLGMVGGAQVLNLDKNGCRFKGLYLHEIGHAVGLVHEHQRPIRDSFIDIIYSNVQPVMRQWFQKYPVQEVNDNVDYEYSSVMHYGVTAFSADGRSKTIQPKSQFRDREEEIGRVYQKELSFTDIESVNKMYGCAEHCDRSVRCTNGGFLDQNCQCICPDGSQDCQVGVQRPPADCVNQNGKNWQCNVWAKQGECARNKNFMYANCQRACGLCGDAFQQYPSIGNQCLNFYTDDICEKWRDMGDCVVNEQWMKKNCKKTCGMCVEGGTLPGTNCPNAYSPEEKCYEWARKGECGANPRWMPFNCAKACRTCQGGNDNGTVNTPVPPRSTANPPRSTANPPRSTARPPRRTTTIRTTTRPTLRTTTPPRPQPDCMDRYQPEKCREFQDKWQFCSVHRIWMEANCMETCKICVREDTTSSSKNDTKNTGGGDGMEKCVDKNKYCKDWAENNQCIVNPGYMRPNCPRSCRLCTAGLREAVETELQRDAGYSVSSDDPDNGSSVGRTSSFLLAGTAFILKLLV